MNKAKLKQLEKKGWRVTTAAEFLGLTPEEEAYIEFRLDLADAIKARREARKMTQQDLAALIGSGQSRVAKIEAADMSVSVDLLVQTLIKLGGIAQVRRPAGSKKKSASPAKSRGNATGRKKKRKAGQALVGARR